MAVTSTAFAQNVTISGRIDMGTASSKVTGSEKQTTSKNSTLNKQGTKGASRITFAGTEDLGGGLTAYFNTETSLNGGAMSDRNLFVGVRGGFGTVQMGRFSNSFSPIRDGHYSIAGTAGGGFLNSVTNSTTGVSLTNFGITAAKTVTATSTAGAGGVLPTNFFVRSGATATGDFVQVFASSTAAGNQGIFVTTDGVGVSSTATAPSHLTMTTDAAINAAAAAADAASLAALQGLMVSAYNTRAQNGLSYTTPEFSGFRLTVGVVDDKISLDTAGASTTKNNVSGQSYSLAYAQGPLAARLTIGSTKIDSKTSSIGESRAKVGENALLVSYNFGVAQTYVMHNSTKSELSQFDGQALSAKRESDATEIGVKMPLGAFEPFVTIGRGEITTANAGVQKSKVKASSHQLGLNYNLSKRTQVYASTGRQEFKTTADTVKTTGYSLGLVHSF